MVTKEIISERFKHDLKILLSKYDAELDVSMEMTEFGVDVIGITIYIPEKFENDILVSEETSIQLTKWVDSESL